MPDRDEVRKKLERDGLSEVRKKREAGLYAKEKVPIIEQWIEEEQAKLDAPTWMYHEIEALRGKVFKASEVGALEKSGWVDTPAKFGVGPLPRLRRAVRVTSNFWFSHWKFLIGTAVAIAGVIATYLAADT